MDSIVDSGFMPHGHCFLWIRELLFLHVGSDLLIAGAYFTIPFALVYLLSKRPDIGFRPVFSMFAVFILACGVTHVLGAWNMWHADYWVSGGAKLVTAVVSVATAVLLWKWMPLALEWPSPAQLQASNEKLMKENRLRQEALLSLHESEKLLSGAFDDAPIGKALVELNGRFIKVNQSLCAILGYESDELKQLDFQAITHPEDLSQDLKYVQELLDGKRSGYQMEKRYVHKKGHLVWVLLSVTLHYNEENIPQFFIAQIQDINDRKKAEEDLIRVNQELEARVAERTATLAQLNRKLAVSNHQLEKLVRIDHLSGLCNRRYLWEQLDKAIHGAERYHTDLCLVMVDIDHFKNINDTHGHVIGDEVISAFGRIVRTNTRDTDIAARMGGDEFCIALHADVEQAQLVAKKIRNEVRKLKITGNQGEPVNVSCSFGVAAWHDAFESPTEFLDAADQSLYSAKQAGRDRVVCLEAKS